MNPVQAAEMSKAIVSSPIPSAFCTSAAMDGNWKSAVDVATITPPTSSGEIPARERACPPARTASERQLSPGFSQRYRLRIPVRSRIH